jgi:hypothetical protein
MREKGFLKCPRERKEEGRRNPAVLMTPPPKVGHRSAVRDTLDGAFALVIVWENERSESALFDAVRMLEEVETQVATLTRAQRSNFRAIAGHAQLALYFIFRAPGYLHRALRHIRTLAESAHLNPTEYPWKLDFVTGLALLQTKYEDVEAGTLLRRFALLGHNLDRVLDQALRTEQSEHLQAIETACSSTIASGSLQANRDSEVWHAAFAGRVPFS